MTYTGPERRREPRTDPNEPLYQQTIDRITSNLRMFRRVISEQHLEREDGYLGGASVVSRSTP